MWRWQNTGSKPTEGKVIKTTLERNTDEKKEIPLRFSHLSVNSILNHKIK